MTADVYVEIYKTVDTSAFSGVYFVVTVWEWILLTATRNKLEFWICTNCKKSSINSNFTNSLQQCQRYYERCRRLLFFILNTFI